jgi:hypothetical protein
MHKVNFQLKNYSSYTETFEIISDSTISISLLRTHADVKIILKNGFQPVQNALVTLGDETQNTNSVGICTFESILLADDLSLDVKKEGYFDLIETLDLKTDTSINLQFVKTHADIAFQLAGDTESYESPYVIFGGDTMLFNFDGAYKFENLPVYVEYDYKIIGANFEDYAGTVYLERDTTVLLNISIVSTGKNQADPSFWIYPNPATDFLRIEGNGREITKIEIIDISGKSIISEIFLLPLPELFLTFKLSEGMYILKIYSAAGLTISRFIVN